MGNVIPYGKIQNSRELGELIRKYCKSQSLTLEKVSGLTNVGIRFLSELERGKETAELGKTLQLLNKLGLEITILPRGYGQNSPVYTQVGINLGVISYHLGA